MIPYRFGAPNRRMFGVYYPPDGGQAMRRTAVLLCNPFGQEGIYSQRLLRVLSERLAKAGFAVLRFDYYATGDSCGACEEGRLHDWADDVLTASAELRARSGCAAVAWMGLRLGASIAVIASLRAGDAAPSGLLLWDPVVSGKGYLDELRDAHCRLFDHEHPAGWAGIAPLVGHAPEGPTDQALGFPLEPALRAEIEALDLAALDPPRSATLDVVATSVSPALEGLRAQFGARAGGVAFHAIRSASSWNSDEAMSSAIVPADVLELVQARLEAAA
jgi:hypothetical protein